MLFARYFLGSIAFAAQCSLFGADAPHVSGWDELFEKLVEQKSLQQHLKHKSAYPLMRVNTTMHALMEGHRQEHMHMIWETLPSPLFTELPLDNGTFIRKETIALDASCNRAYGLRIPENDTESLLLCQFSWPSRNLINRKAFQNFPVNHSTLYKTFFWCGISFIGSVSAGQAHIIGYLPTGFIAEWIYENEDMHSIAFSDGFNASSKRSTIICKTHWFSEHKTIFTSDTSAIVKDGAGNIIPWKKITWDATV